MASCCFISGDKKDRNKAGLRKLLLKEPCQLRVVADVGNQKRGSVPFCRWHFYLWRKIIEMARANERSGGGAVRALELFGLAGKSDAEIKQWLQTSARKRTGRIR